MYVLPCPQWLASVVADFCLLLSPVIPAVLELSLEGSIEWTGSFVSPPIVIFSGMMTMRNKQTCKERTNFVRCVQEETWFYGP